MGKLDGSDPILKAIDGGLDRPTCAEEPGLQKDSFPISTHIVSGMQLETIREFRTAALGHDAIHSLPDPIQAEIVRRRFMENEAPVKIAATLGISLDDVTEKIDQGLRGLRDRLHLIKAA